MPTQEELLEAVGKPSYGLSAPLGNGLYTPLNTPTVGVSESAKSPPLTLRPMPEQHAQHEDEKVARAARDRKPQIGLAPKWAIIAMVRAFEFGALKYKKDNWKNAKNDPEAKRRYAEATIRHALAILDGEDFDPDSGLPHWCGILASGAIGYETDPVTREQDCVQYMKDPRRVEVGQ